MGNASAGVVEFKNDAHAIDQTIAEMLRTAGDVGVLVLTDKKHLHKVTIFGLAKIIIPQNLKL